jgi:hypothetical protein
MSDFVLPLFPLDSSAITLSTSVWVGVLVVCFFNLRLGWTLSGLVIPGYLVPLLLAKPVSVGVIGGEAIVTYWIVYFLSERLNHLPYWSSFFGRDRFLALVCTSVLVRAGAEGWLLPWLGPVLNDLLDINIDYRNDLHSYGLIIVSLLANCLWKPGLVRGLGCQAVMVGTTYLIVRFGLVEFTNFNVGDLSLMYDDISSSLLASPKAYVIVLSTAFLASCFNLRYSWDFSGILVPALLALLWHEPMKIFVSMIEAGYIMLLAMWVLKWPICRQTTMEGGRRLGLFFTICFVHRLVTSHVVQWAFPYANITDFFGFGYLLTTLLAMKAHQKKAPLLVGKATLQVSMLGAVLGNGIGYALTLIPMTFFEPPAPAMAMLTTVDYSNTSGNIVEMLRTDKVQLYSKRTRESYESPMPADLAMFAAGIRDLRQYVATQDSIALTRARLRLGQVNYTTTLVNDRYLYLNERAPERGWGKYIIDTRQSDGLMIQVATPLDEWNVYESGLCLFRELEAGSLAIAGADRQTNRDGSADVLARQNTIFWTFHHAMHANNTLHVRGYTKANAERIAKTDDPDILRSLESCLWVRRAVPPGLRLDELKQLVGRFDVRWGDAPVGNALRASSVAGFAELFLSSADRRRLLALLGEQAEGIGQTRYEFAEGPLLPWVLRAKERMPIRGTNLYVPALQEELMYLDEEILHPLVGLAKQYKRYEESDAQQALRLVAIASAAKVLDYRLVALRDARQNEDFLLLLENESGRRHWGTYVFRFGLESPFIVEVPRPLLESQVIEFGASLFEQLRGSALFLTGAHPMANTDGTSDLARLSNKVNLFNLTHQSYLLQAGDRPMLVVQARSIRAPVDADVVLATDNGVVDEAALSPLKKRLLAKLHEKRLRTSFVDGKPQTAGYELGILLQSSSLNHTENKELMSLWLSPALRMKFRESDDNLATQAQFLAAAIPTVRGDLYDVLATLPAVSATSEPSTQLREAVEQYLLTQDVVRLVDLRQRYADYEFQHVIDRRSEQSFLLISKEPTRLPWVVNVTGFLGDANRTVVGDELSDAIVSRFVDDQAAWMWIRDGRLQESQP